MIHTLKPIMTWKNTIGGKEKRQLSPPNMWCNVSAALMQSSTTTKENDIFIQRECSLYALTGLRSADGLQCLFSSHMTPLASSPNLHSASWTGFLSTLTPLCDWDVVCVHFEAVIAPSVCWCYKVCRCFSQCVTNRSLTFGVGRC